MPRRLYNYKKIYEQHHGKIPKDNFGRSYDIHHIDGNHDNNSIENLVAVTIQEHYNIHYQNEDWAACVLIGLRMNKSPEEISRLNSLAAQKRVENGTHYWKSDEHALNTKNRVNKAIAQGTYHMLGGKVQSDLQRRRSAAKEHQWNGPASNLAMLENGTHPSQKEFICPHCGTKGKGSTNAKRWHFDNCKKKVN